MLIFQILKNGINFQNFGIRNGTDIEDFGMVRCNFSKNWNKERVCF